VSDPSFLGDPTIPSSEGKDGNSHPGSRFMVNWDFGSRLVEWLDMMYVRGLVWPAVQG